MRKLLLSKWAKAILFALCLSPALYAGWRAYQGNLTADPVSYLTHFTGDWTIRFLLITLTVTPLRGLFNQPQMVRFRRMLGLFAFFYGCLHLSAWVVLDKFFDWHEMGQDILKRRFITVGMLALSLMLPLAITSTSGWVRRLGFRRWQNLHRLIYVSGASAVIHYYWLVKSDIREPLMYFGIYMVLMLYRTVAWIRKRPARQPAAAGII